MLSEEHAVLILQRWFRALLWRKKYAITRVLDSDLTDNKAFLVGNDPHISWFEGLSGATPSVFVAISGLRVPSR